MISGKCLCYFIWIIFLTSKGNLGEYVSIHKLTSHTAHLSVLLYFLINSKHTNTNKEKQHQQQNQQQKPKTLISQTKLIHENNLFISSFIFFSFPFNSVCLLHFLFLFFFFLVFNFSSLTLLNLSLSGLATNQFLFCYS